MSDSEEELLLLCYLRNSMIASEIKSKMGPSSPEQNTVKVIEKVKKKQKPRLRPWMSDRIQEANHLFGQYALIKELSSEEDKILKNLNISAKDFYEILHLIKDDIMKKTMSFRRPIPPEARLSITLR